MTLELPDGWDESRSLEQIQIIERIQKAFESGKKYVILSAPTGIGKSWIAATLALNHKEKTFILTKQKSLQDQYVREFPFAYSVKGMGNFPCIQHNCEKDCDSGNCDKCEHKCNIDRFDLLDETKGTKNERIQLKSFSEFQDAKQSIEDVIENFGTFSELDRITRVEKIEARELINKEENLMEIDDTQWFLIQYNAHIYWVNPNTKIPKESKILNVSIDSKKAQTGTLEDFFPDNVSDNNQLLLPYVLKKSICPYWYQRRMGEKATTSIWNYKSFIATQLPELNRKKENNNEWKEENLLICDEAHTLEDELVGRGSIEIKLDFISEILGDQKLLDEIEKGNLDDNMVLSHLESAKKEIDRLWDDKNTHNECLEFLISNQHKQMHKKELGCECRHKVVRNNCKKGCGKLKKFVRDNEHLSCAECLVREDVLVEHEGGTVTKTDSSKKEKIPCKTAHELFTDEWIQKIKEVRTSLSDNLHMINLIRKEQESDFKLRDHFVTHIKYKYAKHPKLVLEPIHVGRNALEIFQHFKKVLFISSTIHEKLFCKEMDPHDRDNNKVELTDDNYEFIHVPNPISIEKREVYYGSGNKIIKKNPRQPINPETGMGVWYEKTMSMITEYKIKRILENRPDKKGIILVNSYDDQNVIANLLQGFSPELRKRLTGKFQSEKVSDEESSKLSLTEQKEYEEKSNEELLEEHISKQNSVLISPSMWEGIDLKGDDGEFVIIATSPAFPKTKETNPRAAAKERLADNDEWWKMRSAFKLMQGVGRCSRQEDDESTAFILDDGTSDALVKNSTSDDYSDDSLVTWLKKQDIDYTDAFIKFMPEKPMPL